MLRKIVDSVYRIERRLAFATPVCGESDLAHYLTGFAGIELLDVRDNGRQWVCGFRFIDDDAGECIQRLLRTMRTDAEITLTDFSIDEDGGTSFRRQPYTRHYLVKRGGHHWSSEWKKVSFQDAFDLTTSLATYNRRICPRETASYAVLKLYINSWSTDW